MGSLRALLSGLVICLTASLPPAGAADFSKPGTFAVGVKTLTAPDVTGSHPLSATVWYPATGSAPDPAIAILSGSTDAPPATTGPFPLVVLIHGLTGIGMTYAPWGAHLASYGFVVMTANFDAGLSAAPDAGISLADKVPIWLLYTRPANVVRVIAFADSLTARDGKLAGVIDTSRIGVWGHSTGGSTALQAAGAQIDFKELDDWCNANPDEKYGESCQFVGHERPIATLYGAADPFAGPLPPLWDSRVTALALAAPGGELHVFGDTGIAAVRVPTLVMVGSADAVVKPAINALWAYDAISSQEKSLAVFDGGGHSLFLRFNDQGFAEAESLTTAFFVDTLRGDPLGHAALLAAAVSPPGLSYRTTMH